MISWDYAYEILGIQKEKDFPDEPLETFFGRNYPLMYDMASCLLEQALGLKNKFREQYLLRHFIVFLLFWLGTIFFYQILYIRFKERNLSLLGVLFLILSPRIFADSHYNPKDLILLPFFLFNTYTFIRFFKNPGIKTAIIHGIVTGMAMNARFTAMLIPGLTVAFVCLDILQNKMALKWIKKYIPGLVLYLATALVFTILLYPYLWKDSFTRFAASFKTMANFPWGSHNLFFGAYIPGEETPWYYLPVWIGITTPILYLFFAGIGSLTVIRNGLVNIRRLRFWNSDQELFDLGLLGIFIGPIAAVIFLNSTLLNGWRHLYFIYPAFIYLAILGYSQLNKLNLKWLNPVLSIVVALSITTTSFFMIKYHPLQNVYFNSLAPKNLTQKFDMDYWGLGYKMAMQKLADEYFEGKKIRIKCANYPCDENYRFLPPKYFEQLELVWTYEEADFFLSNFRRPEEHKKFMDGTFPYQNNAFFIEVSKNPVIGVYRLK